MDVENYINYLRWADTAIFRILRTLDGQTLTDPVATRSGSIHDRLLHLAQEYIIWLADIQDQNVEERIEQLDHSSTQELMNTIEHLHDEWQIYIEETEKKEYEIEETKDLTISLTLSEVVFNLVNHASYHRGQLVTILRVLDHTVPITDFFWYKISLKQGDG